MGQVVIDPELDVGYISVRRQSDKGDGNMQECVRAVEDEEEEDGFPESHSEFLHHTAQFSLSVCRINVFIQNTALCSVHM